eukprot:TRINITY_DN13854_c0_g1_i1.p1 TRINITY_DN13854_c0_g1~~TRINITY_DN13854_c0_g1_i1.p1  ORF type:complete len:436 (+),score=72.96 TRINITY_DN13854_c0_g1_i1:221-1528(+)
MDCMFGVSASGKVLVCGGHLILDEDNLGVTFGLSARFRSIFSHNTPFTDKREDIERTTVKVKSGLYDEVYDFSLNWKDNSFEDHSSKQNTFVKASLKTVFDYIQLIGHKSITSCIEIDLLGHGAFVSKSGKTGLGSSAAMVTSIICGTMKATGLISDLNPLTSPRILNILYNLSTIAHCLAQGKLGSGFDTSCAVFGSQVFGRCPQVKMQECMDFFGRKELELGSGSFDISDLEHSWTKQIPLELPTSFHINMIACFDGSSTPSLARAVKKWRIENPDALEWKNLVTINKKLVELYQLICLNYVEMPTKELLDELRQLSIDYNDAFEMVGTAAGVELVPSAQRLLINDILDLDGVLACGIPGAGGHDALFVLSLGNCNDVLVEFLKTKSDLNAEILPVDLQNGGVNIFKAHKKSTAPRRRKENLSKFGTKKYKYM